MLILDENFRRHLEAFASELFTCHYNIKFIIMMPTDKDLISF